MTVHRSVGFDEDIFIHIGEASRENSLTFDQVVNAGLRDIFRLYNIEQAKKDIIRQIDTLRQECIKLGVRS